MTRVRQHGLIFLLYLAIAVVITFPLITTFSTRLIGHPTSDAYEYIHHVWWIKTALQTGQDPFFMPNIVYPDGVSAVLLWSIPLQSFPAWLFAFVLPLPAAFNLAALLTLALNGWAMFVLVRYLLTLPRNPFAVLTPAQSTLADDESVAGRSKRSAPPLPTERGLGGEVPALIAGLVFMLYPAFQGQLGAAHVGLLTLYPAPLFFYALLRLRDPAHPRRWIIGGALLFVISLWGSVLLLIYLIAPLVVLYFGLVLLNRDGRTFRRALLTVVLGGILSLPFVIPLALDTINAPLEEGSVRYSASLLGVVSPSFYHPLFEHLDYNRQVLGLDPFEWTSYVGVIAAALALIAVWKVRAARAWLLLALVAWVFSLGPLLKIVDTPLDFRVDGYASYVTLPWALFQNLPLIEIARTPARFNFAVGFAVAVLVGYGSAVVFGRLRGGRRWIAVLLLMGLIAFEYQVWWGLPTIPGEVPAPIAALAERTDLRAVLDLPVNSLANKEAMFLQTGHDHPLIIGQVTRHSPVDPAKIALLQGTLDPALLDAAQVDVVIVHKAYDDGTLADRVRQQLGAPFYEDDEYAAFYVPATTATPAFAALPSTDTAIATLIDSDFYAPQAGWVTFSADLSASGGRQVVALLDGKPIQRWTVDGTLSVNLPVTVRARTFHAISLTLDPVCPEDFDPALTCSSVGISKLALAFVPAATNVPVKFDRGVTLIDSHLPATTQPGDALSIWLDWRFDQPLTDDDVRFVHLTDAAGELVAQQDNPLGAIAAGERRAEAVEIALPADLPSGDYTISAGWYSYPEIANFCVLVDGACAGDAATLGTIHVGP